MYVVCLQCCVVIKLSSVVFKKSYSLTKTVCLVYQQCYCLKSFAILSACSIDISKRPYILSSMCERYVILSFSNLKLSELHSILFVCHFIILKTHHALSVWHANISKMHGVLSVCKFLLYLKFVISCLQET